MTKYHKRLIMFVITATVGLCCLIGLIILNFTNILPTPVFVQNIVGYVVMAYVAYFVIRGIVEEIIDFLKPFTKINNNNDSRRPEHDAQGRI